MRPHQPAKPIPSPSFPSATPLVAPGDPPPRGLDVERHLQSQATAAEAEIVRLAVAPALVSSALGLPDVATPRGIAAYIEQIVATQPDSDNPLVRVLVEMTYVAHLNAMRLHTRACEASSDEAASLLSAAAAKLSAEARKTIETLYSLPGSRSATKRSTATMKVVGG